ncbi:hypothetical protein DER46DRAFT_569018 [Fusarium sp. MPI-SDFR-AT-0072]|nr:hypothetical protein DER46DRAFT_569018 [Fusarium sp. MPI-SDFR-AT-0072]
MVVGDSRPTLLVVMETTHHTRVAVMVMGVRISAPIMAVVIVLVGTVELSVPREVTVVVTTLHTRAVVGVVELEMKDPDPIKVLVVLLTHHLGLVVRMARAFMPPEDMIAIAENKGMKRQHQGYGDGNGCQRYGQDSPGDRGHGNGTVAEQPRTWQQEVPIAVVGTAHSSTNKTIYGTYEERPDEAVIRLNKKLPEGPHSILIICHCATKASATQVRAQGEDQLAIVGKLESSAASGQANKDSRGGAQVSATDGNVKADPIRMGPSADVIPGSIEREPSEDVRMGLMKKEVSDAPPAMERAKR